MRLEDASVVQRTAGTPLGVISPLLAKLVPHYAFEWDDADSTDGLYSARADMRLVAELQASELRLKDFSSAFNPGGALVPSAHGRKVGPLWRLEDYGPGLTKDIRHVGVLLNG